jgi:hypothetical protein
MSDLYTVERPWGVLNRKKLRKPKNFLGNSVRYSGDLKNMQPSKTIIWQSIIVPTAIGRINSLFESDRRLNLKYKSVREILKII